MAEVIFEVLSCRCGRGGISVKGGPTSGGTRITPHKCTGQWTVTASYRVNAEEVVRVVEDAAEDMAKAEARRG